MLKRLFYKLKRWIQSLKWQIQGYPPFDIRDMEDDVEDEDMPDYCQDCGCMLDWEMKGSGDDIIRPGYVTASGDVFCSRCGREYDEEEERQNEDYYEPPYDQYEEGELDDDDPDGHSLECTCETCIQNHPERINNDEEDECSWEDEE